jgi:truncated hemoglobin YjbI
MSSSYDRIGGEPALRAIVSDFVDRVFDDVMIGFLFRDVDRRKLKELEFQHAAEHLGGPVRYRGRPLDEAHEKHRILGGQFARRKELLRQTLVAHGVAAEIVEQWLAYTESLRSLVTADAGGECRD